jgi:hypothetical protein
MDIVLTWPKRTSYENYVGELKKALNDGKVILFSVSAFPVKAAPGDRCYMVHDGQVRGWSEIVAFHDGDGPDSVRQGEEWAKGKYIVRSAHWHKLLKPIEMKGFQGFRYAPKWWRGRVSVG